MELAHATAPSVGLLKIGLTAFVAHGRDLVTDLADLRPVFLDLKLHDIPVQVAGAMRAAAATGAAFVTVHAAGGTEMIRAAVESAGATRVLAVTVLTSLDADALRALGFNAQPDELVADLAAAALDAGAHGLVCSSHEVAGLRSRFGAVADGGPFLVVPGIRDGTAGDDQRRTASAAAARAAGADILVVGRPITAAPDPAAAARALATSL
ncbi:MAG: orotidine-5'-phosphate decarboxylase [Actinomycetota bacterium]|nr:orotidine-5'-phosphate decarboxylase [Actinomycetota bacterium]